MAKNITSFTKSSGEDSAGSEAITGMKGLLIALID